MQLPLTRPLSIILLCLALATLFGCGASRSAESGAPARPGAPPAAPIAPGKPVTPVTVDAPQPADASGDASADASGASPQSQAAAKALPRQGDKAAGALDAQRAARDPDSASSGTNAASRVAADLLGGYRGPEGGQVAACWLPLVQRLKEDPGSAPEMAVYFCGLPEYSPKPMGVKVKELFTSAFLRKKKPADGRPQAPRPRIYRNVVTAASMGKCADFLAVNKELFDRVEEKYPVPREVLVALLYVETRLGVYVGKDNAFWSLACMAAADSPDMVQDGVKDVPLTAEHENWLQGKLSDKSDWAYKELRALLKFCQVNNLDPRLMPGSVYGAIGICQFMPSNLNAYGEDGDGDGVINLFSEADAVFSAARYLSKHGWKKQMSVAAQRDVLKRYNNLNIYANTILALAESVRSGVLQSGPPGK